MNFLLTTRKDRGLGLVSRKSRKLFGSEKPSVKLRPACSVKLLFFSHDVKGRKIKITAKFSVLERFGFQHTKRIMSPDKFRDFRETGPWPIMGKKACKATRSIHGLIVLLAYSIIGAANAINCKYGD